ncbi:hypothetical protein P280DRAFT_229388 [Massarina eburnea CBS 473.64]|uniref:Uncharacterized protein n=1 Tax=Massarina eburnea CBS 473.64 TaxID=1395130 RepID=A0A6A6S8W4_9PLEO|nr:hypothetical protein P280DRAFT_229388 [Massarina eburnea CBS 473.64]
MEKAVVPWSGLMALLLAALTGLEDRETGRDRRRKSRAARDTKRANERQGQSGKQFGNSWAGRCQTVKYRTPILRWTSVNVDHSG